MVEPMASKGQARNPLIRPEAVTAATAPEPSVLVALWRITLPMAVTEYSVFLGRPLAALFLEASEGEIIGNARMLMIYNTAFYALLALVNIIRFLIQGMGFPAFAILAALSRLSGSESCFVSLLRTWK